MAAQNQGWLQILINLPPHQDCSVVWRRSCPGAKAAYEGGMDLASPKGTPIYSLGDGQVIGAGYFWHPNGNPGYGVVTIRTSMPDGTVNDIYYQHIIINKNIQLCSQYGGQLYGGITGPPATFQSILKNQLLGWVSDAGECEVGANANWDGIWGVAHPGPWYDDPEDIVRQLMAAGGGTGSNINFNTGIGYLDTALTTAHGNATTAVQTLTQIPGIGGPIQVFHNAQQFHPFQIPDDNSPVSGWPGIGGIAQATSAPVRVTIGMFRFIAENAVPFVVRSVFVIIAVILIIALLINLTSHELEEHPEIGQAVTMAAMA